MKIAIAGAGVTGCFLGHMLNKKGHDVEIFETAKKDEHWAVCAWGASKHMLSKFSEDAGLNFNDYILHEGKNLIMDLPQNKKENLILKGLVTYNKQKWENDLLNGLTINYNSRCDKSFPFNNYNYVLDCTGLHRTLLPRSKEDFIIPAFEYLVENINEEYDEFYVIGYKGARGYFWYFPLEKGRGFVGAGDIDRKYYGINEFLSRNPSAKIIKKIGRPIRLSPPKRMEPFYVKNIIGIGESIGCVFPMLGEGIIPSLICCELFLKVLDDNPESFNFTDYRKKVLKRFGYYDDVYRIVRLKMDGKLSTLKHGKLLMNMYKNMKEEEKRFGFEISLKKMRKLVNAL